MIFEKKKLGREFRKTKQRKKSQTNKKSKKNTKTKKVMYLNQKIPKRDFVN